MPIPAGFTVVGAKPLAEKHSVPIPPRVQKIINLLNTLPENELLTTMEMTSRLGLSTSGGSFSSYLVLIPYRAKVDNKLFWGNRKSIVQLQAQLAESEETPNES